MVVSRLAQIPGIGVDRMGSAADAAGSAEMLRLENLDTDIPPPPAAIAATEAAIRRDDANSYLPFLGTKALREAAAARISRSTGIEYDPDGECIVCAGGLSGILNALLALLEPGDEVVITDPAYAGLLNRIRLAGGVPVLVPLVPSPTGWSLDLDRLEATASPRVRAILTMSPSMPSGITHDDKEWSAIRDLAVRTDAWVLHDAAMERILFGGRKARHPATIDGLAERTITVGSVSKEYRMIGWRVGWVVGPRAIMNDIGLVSLTNVVCQVGIAMPGATAALTATDDGVADAVRTWEARRDAILTACKDLPIVPAHGGWSLLVDTVELGMRPDVASKRCFELGKIAATAMTGWGADERAGRYLRFVFANEPVARLADIRERLRAAWGV